MRQVFVPCKRIRGWSAAVIEDADGWPRAIKAGHLTIVDTWLCLTAEVLDELRGRVRVKFADGTDCWVNPHSCWRHDPRLDDVVVPGSEEHDIAIARVPDLVGAA